MSSRARLALLLALALAACQSAPPAHPALWRIDGPGGQRAWLMGTVHALPQPVRWRSAGVDGALSGADRIVLEVARIDDDRRTAAVFARLAHSPGHPPLEQRVEPAMREPLGRLLATYPPGRAPADTLETWAAALMLAQGIELATGVDSGNGIDRAVRCAADGRPVEEFEGAEEQLRIFDALPESDQRALLAAVIAGAGDAARDEQRMRAAWASGDMATIASDTQGGLLAAPGLRAALLERRNRAWAEQLAARLRSGQRPFVAVGAAHLAGPDGLPALLAARGYRLTRLQ